MGYDFTVREWYSIKAEEKQYPWPWSGDKGRTITIYNDDVLTKSEDGTYMKQTGLGCFGIQIPDEDLIFHDKPSNLRLI